jgi:hypothetical protein
MFSSPMRWPSRGNSHRGGDVRGKFGSMFSNVRAAHSRVTIVQAHTAI